MNKLALLSLLLCATSFLLLVGQTESRAFGDDDDDDPFSMSDSDEDDKSQEDGAGHQLNHHGHHAAPAPVAVTTTTTTTTTTTKKPTVKMSGSAASSMDDTKSAFGFLSLEEESDAEPDAVAPTNDGQNAGRMGAVQSTYAGFDESCGQGEYNRHCDAGKDMVCSPKTSRCECNPGVNDVYIQNLKTCMKISAKATDFSCVATEQCQRGVMGQYSECNQDTKRCQCVRRFGQTEVIQYDDRCYLRKVLGDYCEDDASCDASIEGKAVCIYKPPDQTWPPAPHVIPINATKMCLCGNDYVFDNSTYGDKTKCLLKGVDESSLCQADIQCTAGMGPLSRCHESQCQCQDVLAYKSETVFYKGTCYIKLDLNDQCDTNEQCQAGIHENAICARHDSYLMYEKVCQCPAGKSCTGKGGAAATTVISSLNLFVLAVIATKVML